MQKKYSLSKNGGNPSDEEICSHKKKEKLVFKMLKLVFKTPNLPFFLCKDSDRFRTQKACLALCAKCLKSQLNICENSCMSKTLLLPTTITKCIKHSHLLPVTWWLLEGLDDEGGRWRDDVDLGLTVLDGEPDGDLQTLPILGGLGDVVTDLLRWQTEGTDLGGKGRSSSDLASHCPQANDLKAKRQK